MIGIKKTFYAIGQGCFYSEQIHFKNEVRTIVYDCGAENGSSPNKDRLKKEIQQSGLGVIDYLVISHFHKDHINGIDELKKHCVIKNVIIPKIDALDVAFYLGTKNTIEDLLLNPKKYFEGANDSEDPNIITVDTERDQNNIEDPNKIPNNISHNTNLPLFNSGSDMIWILRFYVDKRVFGKDLSPEQKKLIQDTLTITDYEENKDKLIEAYKALNKDVNLTTMSMLSAPTDRHPFYYHYHPYSISLMNGDILLNTEERIRLMVDHFSQFRNYIFDFHIPHHGSHKNLLRPINEWMINKGIIMSGYFNQYGHPSGIVLRKFKDAKISVKTLTEYDKNYCKSYNL